MSQVTTRQLSEAADKLYETKTKRLALQKQVDELKHEEKELTDFLVNNLSKADTTGVSGKTATAKVVTKDIPIVTDWDAFYNYVHANRAFELLQRRLGSPAVKERWESGETIAGVGTFTDVSISITRR
jgi:hypothetical protein